MKELCWKCKQVKDGVKLTASDDRLCESCFQLNETALLALRRGQAETHLVASSQTVETKNDRKNDKSEKSASKPISGNDCIFVNELLSYVSYYRDRANSSAIQRVVLLF